MFCQKHLIYAFLEDIFSGFREVVLETLSKKLALDGYFFKKHKKLGAFGS